MPDKKRIIDLDSMPTNNYTKWFLVWNEDDTKDYKLSYDTIYEYSLDIFNDKIDEFKNNNVITIENENYLNNLYTFYFEDKFTYEKDDLINSQTDYKKIKHKTFDNGGTYYNLTNKNYRTNIEVYVNMTHFNNEPIKFDYYGFIVYNYEFYSYYNEDNNTHMKFYMNNKNINTIQIGSVGNNNNILDRYDVLVGLINRDGHMGDMEYQHHGENIYIDTDISDSFVNFEKLISPQKVLIDYNEFGSDVYKYIPYLYIKYTHGTNNEDNELSYSLNYGNLGQQQFKCNVITKVKIDLI